MGIMSRENSRGGFPLPSSRFLLSSVLIMVYHHSSRIRFLRFFQNAKKRDFLRFFEVSCQTNVKKRRKPYPSFMYLGNCVKDNKTD